MSLKQLLYTSLNDIGCGKSNGVYLMCSSALVAPKNGEPFSFHYITGTITDVKQLQNSKLGKYFQYTISYDDTQVATGKVFVAGSITAVVCAGAWTQFIQDLIGNEILVSTVAGVTTITSQHGVQSQIVTSTSTPQNGLIFGDGSDGDLTIPNAQTYTLPFPSRNMSYSNLNISLGGRFNTYGQAYFASNIPALPTLPGLLTGLWFNRISVAGTLTIAGLVDSSGYSGANGATGSTVAVNPGAPVAEDGAGGGGDWGGFGGGAATATRIGGLPLGYRNGTTGQMAGGFGGKGGNGGSDGTSSGYAGADPQADNGGRQSGYPTKIDTLRTDLLDSGGPYALGRAGIIGGGTGGGGGGAGQGVVNGGDGGGGGAGGGTIFFVANNIVLQNTAVLRARGGNGGTGGNGSGSSVTTYNILGQVVNASVGAGIGGVTVNAGAIGITTTAVDGTFVFLNVLVGTNFSISVSKAGYTFAPNPQIGTVTAITTVPNFVGTPVVTGYTPFTYFPGTFMGWYPAFNSAACLNGGSPATNGQLVTSIIDEGGGGGNATQATTAKQPKVVTGVLNGQQVIEWDDNAGAFTLGSFGAGINNASSVLVGWVGSITDGTANGSLVFGRDATDSNFRLRPFFVGIEPSGEWNTKDGVDESNQAIGSPLLAGITNFHAVLMLFNFASGTLNIWQDNFQTVTNYTHGTAQNIPNTNMQEAAILLSMKGQTADLFMIKNFVPTGTQVTNWFAAVKSFFGLTSY